MEYRQKFKIGLEFSSCCLFLRQYAARTDLRDAIISYSVTEDCGIWACDEHRHDGRNHNPLD